MLTCIKTRDEAEKPVNTSHVNYGIGDSMYKINGTLKACNCDLWGYNMPTALVIDGVDSYIYIQEQGQQVNDSVFNAISAGPNLVSYNQATGKGYVDIPLDDHNINVFEHASNTAIGLKAANGTKYLCVAILQHVSFLIPSTQLHDDD